MSSYKATTVQGYSLFEVSSAFQKSVRRGLEDEAMYWAVELFESNYDGYLWKRIRIISSEDIGLASNISSQVYSLWQMYEAQKKLKDEKNRPERLFLTHAVLLVCRSAKSRVIDHALLHYWCSHYQEKRPVPAYAYDKHTQQGRKLGLGWEHFFTEGTKLENMADVPGEERYREQARQSVKNCDKPGQPDDQIGLFG